MYYIHLEIPNNFTGKISISLPTVILIEITVDYLIQ